MSYRMRTTERQRHVGRSVFNAQQEIARAVTAAKSHGLSQQAIAEKLGVDRSVVNRQVTGKANMTLRSIAELGWAIGLEPRLVFVNVAQSAAAETPGRSAPSAWHIMPGHDFFEGHKTPLVSELLTIRAPALLETEAPLVSVDGSLNDDECLYDDEPLAQAA